MAPSLSAAQPATLPEDFLAAWRLHGQGQASLEQLTRALGAALEQDLHCATALQRFVLAARDQGTLDEAGFDALMEAIDRVLTEDVPTEYSLDGEPPGAPPAVPAPGRHVAPLVPGDLLKGRYQLEELVAASACHHVFRATDRSPAAGGQTVALKVVSAAPEERSPLVTALGREAAIGRRLTHANIVRTYDLDCDGPYTFLCLEWLDGESLARVLDARRGRPMPRVQALQIIEGICRGLAAAHAEGVVHGDLKPGNVFITRAGQVRLLDLGAARLPGEEPRPALRGRTPEYASCEVLEGAEPEPADDLFSAALVAYRMLAGERAFGPGTAREAEAGGLAPARIENLTPGQWRALNRALAFRRTDRQASVTAFLAELKGPRDEAPQGLRPAEATPPAAPRSRMPLGQVAVALAMAAGGLALGWTLASAPAGPAPAATAAPARSVGLADASTPAAVPTRAAIPTPGPVVRAAGPASASAPDPTRNRVPVPPATAAPEPSARVPAPPPAPDAAARPDVPAETGTGTFAVPVALSPSADPPLLMTAALGNPPAGDPLPPPALESMADPPDRPGAPADTSAGEPSVPFSSLRLRRYVEARYPALSAARAEPGWVDVEFRVDGAGKPRDLQVLGAEPAGRFENAALAAVRRWRFDPPAGGGPVLTRIRVRFDPD